MICIEPLLRTVESYLKCRAAVVRKLNDHQFSPAELKALTNVPYTMLFRRRQNAAYWRSSELEQLANVLSLSPAPIAGVQTLANQLQSLPKPVRVPLLKEARLEARQLLVRGQNADKWQCHELEHLAGVLRRWQNTKS